MRYAANLSILFPELTLLDRPAAAAHAGFTAVESWWPWPTATPTKTEVDDFATAIESAGVQLIALNVYAGDMPAGDRGIASWPGRSDEFAAAVRACVEIGDRLGTKLFNALYGSHNPDPTLAIENLRRAATAVARIGGTILLEPLSAAPDYPLRTSADIVALLDEIDVDNVAMLADLYHLSVNGDDVAAAIDVHFGRIGHVQIADSPGRHEPGTGDLDLSGWLRTLDQRGYPGYVAAEYLPTDAGFDWMDQL